MAKNKNEGEVVVRSFPRKKQAARTGKPRKIATTSLRMGRTAYAMTGNTMLGAGGNFYSPELSTDFLELPQSIDERRNFYRFFYDHEPFVGQAIDLHDDLPFSKVRLAMPIARNRDLAEQAMRFCERWVREVHLLQRLLEISHEYHLLGEAVIFCEDTSPEMPRSVREREIREITAEGEIIEQWEEYEDADDREVEWLKKNYKGWTAIRCLPPEQVHIDSFPFTDEKLIKLVPDSKTVDIVQRAQDVGDTQAKRIVASMSEDIVNAILMGEDIILNTDPDAGSFAYVMARKRSQYEPRGQSILQRCLLPGTPIWVKQDGIIQQVAVEDVNDGTYVLTHKGRFQPCEAGSRLVEESVTSLSIEGIEDPLRLTSDHRVLRVAENGEEEWIEAGNLKEGDLVREAYIEPTEEPLTEIDLVAWWQGRSLEGLETESPNIKIPITKDFCYLLGTWLGGGCFWRNLHDVLSVGWDIQNGDLEVVERVREISSQYFLDVQELDSCKIQIKNSLLARWFKNEFRPTGPNKHLPK